MLHLIRTTAAAVLIAAAACAMTATRAGAADEIVVFAAASLKNALDDVATAWTAKTGHRARISYAGSSHLARQIEQGAPADVYVSANGQWMDVLQQGEVIYPPSRRDILSNRLVLVAHGRSAASVEIEPDFELRVLLGDGKLAMAMVDSVPAGIYGRAALASLGVWETVEASVAQTDNVRSALALVARGEAPFGIVYATDAAASDAVTVVGTFPTHLHPPIRYPAAVVAESRNRYVAEDFLAFLSTPEAVVLFDRHGFIVDETITKAFPG